MVARSEAHRVSRPRFTIRFLMLAVAVAGLACAALAWALSAHFFDPVVATREVPYIPRPTVRNAPVPEAIPNGPDAFAK
jgi:hypothetical protein